MRRSILALLLGTGLLAGCDSPAPAPPPAPIESAPAFAATPSLSDLKTRIDALLPEPARTQAINALGQIAIDLLYRRSTLYQNGWRLAAIPIAQRQLNRIPPDKIPLILDFLCRLSQYVPLNPPNLPKVNFCALDPNIAASDAVTQVVFADQGATVMTQTEHSGLRIVAGSLPAGQAAILVTAVPLRRLQPFQCYYVTNLDCYPEFYEWNTVPAVKFTPAATLAVCQENPGATAQSPPNNTVLNRLRIFTVDGNQQVRLLTPTGVPSTPLGNCDSEPHPVAIGPIGFSAWGMHNGLLALARAGSRALDVFRPSVAYATNVPTHGLVFDEWLLAAPQGNVLGSVDPVVRVASASLAPTPTSVLVGSTRQLTVTARDKVSGVITRPLSVTWSSSNAAVATVNASGLVTGIAAGAVTITANVEGVTATASVTVDPSFVGVWSGSWAQTGNASNTGPLTVTIASQTGTTVTGVYDLGYNTNPADRNFTGQISGNTISFRFVPFIAVDSARMTLTRSGSTMTGTEIDYAGAAVYNQFDLSLALGGPGPINRIGRTGIAARTTGTGARPGMRP